METSPHASGIGTAQLDGEAALRAMERAMAPFGVGFGGLGADNDLAWVGAALERSLRAWREPRSWWRQVQRSVADRFGSEGERVMQHRPIGVELLDPEGSTRIFEVALVSGVLASGLVVVARDITEEAQEHERLELSNEELRHQLKAQLEQERTAGTYLSDVLSRLRMPLHTIVGHNEMLQEDMRHGGVKETLIDLGCIDVACRELLQTICEIEGQVEAQVARRRLAEEMQELTRTMSATLELRQVFEVLVGALGRVVTFDAAVAWVRRGDQLNIVLRQGRPRFAPEAMTLSALPVGLLIGVLKSRMPHAVEDGRSVQGLEEGAASGLRGWLIIPLAHQTDVVGLLTLESERAGAFGSPELEIGRSVSEHAGAAVNNARLFEEVHRLSVTDELTGVPNRRHFMEVARREFARARDRGRPVSAIMMDVDRFKVVNEEFGHRIGDEVLREIAQRCERVLRDEDVFGRYGGEEFAVLLPETDRDRAHSAVAERLRQIIEREPILTSRGPVRVTASLGVAEASANQGLLDVLDSADQALFRAKAAGRNSVAE